MEILNGDIQSWQIKDRFRLGPGAFISNFNVKFIFYETKKKGEAIEQTYYRRQNIDVMKVLRGQLQLLIYGATIN